MLAYIVTGPGQHKDTVTGLRPLLVSNAQGRALRMMGDLRAGHAYRYSIAAVGPAGIGPAVTSPALTPS